MYDINDFDKLELTFQDGKITSFTDSLTNTLQKSFYKRLVKKSIAKLYVIKEDDKYLYVGATIRSLTERFRLGLTANGKNGYHGYKFKNKKLVQLYVWSFDGLKKIEIENIEAELVFVIRLRTGQWPLTQNEIHFNNNYEEGKSYAENLFDLLQSI